MHYHMELILPPTPVELISDAVDKAMRPFQEADDRPYAFWDWYEIGGRWNCEHLKASMDQLALDNFYKWLSNREITVNAVRAGKPKLDPANQWDEVNTKWREMFGPNVPCMIFKEKECAEEENISLVKDLPANLIAHRVAVCDEDNEIYFMRGKAIWNGCNHEKTDWDGLVVTAINEARDSYPKSLSVEADWMAVTVDYHS